MSTRGVIEGATTPAATVTSKPVPALLVFLGVLGAEYLFLSYSIDARDVLGPAGIEGLLGGIGSVAPLAFLIVLGAWMAGGRGGTYAAGELSRWSAPPPRRWMCGAAHGVLMAGAFGAVSAITRGLAYPELSPLLWLLAATVLSGAGVLALALSLWNMQELRRVAWTARRALVIGSATGLVAWGAGLLAQHISRPATWITLELVHALLTVIASDPVAAPELAQVGTSRFFVDIAPVCSGIEGMGLMAAFMGVFLYLERADLRWPRALLLLPLSLLSTFGLNVIRVTALIALGTWVSPEVALGGFHSKAGWVFFTLVALAAVWIARRSVYFSIPAAPQPIALPLGRRSEPNLVASAEAQSLEAAAQQNPGESSANPAVPYVMPLVVVIATTLFSGLFTSGFDWLYPVRVLAAAAVLVAGRRHYSAMAAEQRGIPWLALGVGLAVAAVWIAWFNPGSEGDASALAERLARLPTPLAGTWLAFRVIGTVITIPIVEELAFRGYLMRRLVSKEFEGVDYRRVSLVALAVSSLAFGVLHQQWWLGAMAGVAYGAIVMARRRLSDAIVAHAVTNGAIVVYVLFTSDWALLA